MNFNPRLREGGDLHLTTSLNQTAFQSTPPRRRRPELCTLSDNSKKFQSTPPRRRRRSTALTVPAKRYFNPRLREGGDWGRRCQCWHNLRFQSTPPRRRRPQHIVIPQLSCTYLVSTTFLSAIFSFISQYVVLFFLF